jgi:hypothetical protein
MLVAAAAVYKQGENDVFAGAVHGRSGGLPECIGCKRG